MIGSMPAGRTRSRSLLLVVALNVALLGLSGCSGADSGATGKRGADAGESSRAAGAAKRPAPPAPAAEAGGVCELLDYARAKAALGVEFGAAAAAQRGETHTCVIQPRTANFPDLALSITATGVDDKAFTTAMVPKGASGVAGLGKAAYSIAIPVAGASGPGVELGWLSASKRLMVIRYRLASNLTPQDAAATLPNLVELAKALDGITPSSSPTGSSPASAAGSAVPSGSAGAASKPPA